ncbi:hypothetical protein LCGC14_0963370 [marine sediment metagenome]|uniref:Uncharacterized protein n=1 Tax=marine sediment metagenome TaxID=412755 RepID=A0A0F9RKB8_9ZZZZ
MQSQCTLSPWMKFKRYSDNVKVEARLVQVGDRKLMEVRESKGDEIVCSCCGHILSQVGGKLIPNFQLEPKIFHERHKPLDMN